MWVPDFSPEHFNKMLYTKEGITERVRTDLTGPDGKPGISLAGHTMHNMYLEMSKGAYTVDGQATPWIKVPHSEALVRRVPLLPGRGRQLGRRSPAVDERPPGQPAGRGPARPPTRSTRSPRWTRASRGPTTTSRTRATATVTATSSSPTA